MLYIAVR